MLPHKTMRLAILACAYSLIVEGADLANSPALAVPKPASDSTVPKPASDSTVPKPASDSSVPKPASVPPVAKTASGAPVPKPASVPPAPQTANGAPVPKPASVPPAAQTASRAPVPKPASVPPVPQTASGVPVPKPASDSVAAKTPSGTPEPKSSSGSATNTDALGQPSPLFQPITSSKPLRVLGFFPYNGYSHFIMFKAIMSELAKRGHHVTVVSPFPLKTPQKNYHDVDLSDIFKKLVHDSTLSDRVAIFDSSFYHRVKVIVGFNGPEQCRKSFNHPKVKTLLSGSDKFDVIFTEVFGTDCYLALGHVLKAPVINVVTSHTIHWMHDYVGDVNHPAIVPDHFNPRSFKDLSYFGDRFYNAFVQKATKIVYYFLSTLPSEKVVRDTFGDTIPSLEELRYKVGLVMVNSHPTIFGAKPTVPKILPIGGIHLQSTDRQEVPEDIKLWLDTAPHGVLLFSLGSLVSPHSIPPRLIKEFVSAFYELRPLRILWKYKPANNSAEAATFPDNIKLVDWVPQQEVLSHPNTVAFMTHGGLMGLFEGIYYGVPMIGIPLFGDQLMNVLRFQKIGCAKYLHHATLTKEDVMKAVIQVTTNSTVRQRVKEVSRQFRDRPMSPLDSAIWWTEYIARHGGAPHLESPTARMPFWQYALLDVIATALAIAILILYFVYFVIRSIWRFRRRSTPLKSPLLESKKQV